MTILQWISPDIKQSEVMFVLTVPAILSDASKELMVEAAVAVCLLFQHYIAHFKFKTNRYLCVKHLQIVNYLLLLIIVEPAYDELAFYLAHMQSLYKQNVARNNLIS